MRQGASLKVLVCDLDDTLCLERDFVKSGFRAVSALLSHRSGISFGDVFGFMWNLFETGVRGTIFDLTVSHFNLSTQNGLVSELVAVYRSHPPNIRLSPRTEGFLSFMDCTYPLGLITDGWPETQHQKIDALGIERFFEKIIITDEWSKAYRKPHPRAFAAMEDYFNVPGECCVYLADNPHKDFITPNERGWATIRIRRPGQLYADVRLDERYEAQNTVTDLSEAVELLESKPM
jgi:putative hydrolase of the HAD superfamily